MGLGKFLGQLNEFSGSLTGINNNLSGVKEQGFSSPNVPGGDVGLPFTKVPYSNEVDTSSNQIVTGTSVNAIGRRHLINWFVPDLGVIRMYVNPDNFRIDNKKLIKPTRTKGGYSLQYWGEDITTVQISGSTGSSGVEGINMLYEIYRAEQYTFDVTGLTMSANNPSQNIAGNLISSIAGGGGSSSLLGVGISSLLSPSVTALSPLSMPTLANNAFTVEMYYMGWVFRGYIENMTITETVDLLFTYSMTFKVTQRRGYRTNFLPWHKTPIGGGGNLGNHYDEDYDQATGTATSKYYSFK